MSKLTLKQYPDVLNPCDIQEILSVGEKTVYKLLQNNVIKSKKIGRLYKIPKRFVIDYLTGN